VIDLDVSDIEPQLVVEGIVSNIPTASMVRLGFTQSAYTNSPPRDVNGAQVVVSDDAGNSEVLKQSSPGVFVPSVMNGVTGRKYTLNVTIDGREYSASSVMPMAMSLDSVRNVTSGSWLSFNSTTLQYYLTNRPGVAEFCLIKAYNQGSTAFVWTIYSDKYSDGQQVQLESPAFTPTGNTMLIEVISIDEATYEYFYSLREILGDGSISIPDLLRMSDFNPKSNLTNNALGYFSAQSKVLYTFRLK
jgi:hypothetical protein